ncbi:MAG: hypothetical protein M0038_04040 [Pseudomonadota bacterium]|nr:hypothetical protein [Pseudomonadota bacterium]
MSGVTVETVGSRTRVWLDGRLVYDSAAQAAPCPPACRCWWAKVRRRLCMQAARESRAGCGRRIDP